MERTKGNRKVRSNRSLKQGGQSNSIEEEIRNREQEIYEEVDAISPLGKSIEGRVGREDGVGVGSGEEMVGRQMCRETSQEAVNRLTVPNRRRGPASLELCIAAFVAGEGFISRAARILNITTTGYRKYIKRYKLLRELVVDYQTQRLDETERQLLLQIKRGDTNAIKFYLHTQGKERGYIPETRMSSKNENHTKIEGEIVLHTYLDFAKQIMIGNGNADEQKEITVMPMPSSSADEDE